MIHDEKNILSGKHILLISPESWGINFVSKHHYAIELSRTGNKVYFLNPPGKVNSKFQINYNLWVLNYKHTLRGLRILPNVLSGLLIKREIEKLEKWLHLSFDIIWNFDSSRFFNLSQIKNILKIAHIVDWTENFNRKILSKTSDLNLCTSKYLEEELKKYNPRTYNIGHGYKPSDYKLTRFEENLIKDQYEIKVGYIGNLSIKYINWKLLFNLLSEYPSIGFYFIGPLGKSNLSNKPIKNLYYNKIRNFDNAIFLGEILSEKIPAYLRRFDILLLVYEDNKYRMQLANPHKILEYLGSGKTVISTYTEEYKSFNELIEMVSDSIEFQNKFKEVLNNLDLYNSNERSLKRIQYALGNTYYDKIMKIERLLNLSDNN